MGRSGATGIGNQIGLLPKNVNDILHQMGYIKKSVNGWALTELGRKHSGGYSEKTNYPVPTFEIDTIVPLINKFLKSKNK